MLGKVKIRRFRWTDLTLFASLFNRLNGVDGTPRAVDESFMSQFLSHPSMMAEQNAFVAERDGSLEGYLLVFLEQPISRSVGVGGSVPGPDEAQRLDEPSACGPEPRKNRGSVRVPHAGSGGCSCPS